LVMGHDFSGQVVEVGEKAAALRPGDRVAVDPQRSCGTCHFCRQGLARFCAQYSYMGKGFEGSYQEYVLIDERYICPIPDGVSHEEAAILEPFAVALHAFEFLSAFVGETIVISGCGPMGLAHIQLAKAMGYRVVALEVIEARREAAETFGADLVLDPTAADFRSSLEDELSGRHYFIECAGVPASLKTCIDVIGRGGRLAMVGGCNLDVNLRTFLLKGLTFYGVRGGGGMYPRAIKLVARGVVDAASMISTRYPLVELDEAIRNNLANKSTIIKTIVEY